MQVECPLCGQVADRSFPARYGSHPQIAGQPVKIVGSPSVFICGDCGFRFTSPLLDSVAIETAYAAAGTNVWPEDPRNSVRRDYPSRVRSLIVEAPDNSVLDIGCYTGEFLAHFPGDWRRVGIEPGSAAADVARSRQIEIVGRDCFSASIPKESFGVITVMNVIEHVPDPREFVRTAVEWLKEDGLLVIETGDVESGFARLMGAYWGYYHLPEHVSFFPLRTMEALLRDCGLEISINMSNLQYKRPWRLKGWLHSKLMLCSKLSKSFWWRARESTKGSAVLNDLGPLFVHKDHMFVVGRKIAGGAGIVTR